VKKILFTVILLTTLIITGCRQNNVSKNGESELPKANEASTEIIIEIEELEIGEESWQEAYTLFLKDFPADSEYNNADFRLPEFSLRDLDENGIPELLILQAGEYDGLVTVFTYVDNIIEIGSYTDPKIAVSLMLYSSKPNYPGLFTVWWGGGVEHYGYLSVKDEQLIHEELYKIELAEDKMLELSNNKLLINESLNAFSYYEYDINLNIMHIINDDNIADVIGSFEENSYNLLAFDPDFLFSSEQLGKLNLKIK